MKYCVAFIGAFFLATFSASALPYGQVLGVTPDLLLIFVASWAMIRGQGEALVVAPLAGFLRDLTTSDPVGTSVLALAPIVLLAALRDLKMVETDFLPTLAVVAVGTITYATLSMAVLTATGQEVPWLTVLVRAVVPAVIVNMLFTPIVYLPVRWFSGEMRTTIPKLGPNIRI